MTAVKAILLTWLKVLAVLAAFGAVVASIVSPFLLSTFLLPGAWGLVGMVGTLLIFILWICIAAYYDEGEY